MWSAQISIGTLPDGKSRGALNAVNQPSDPWVKEKSLPSPKYLFGFDLCNMTNVIIHGVGRTILSSDQKKVSPESFFPHTKVFSDLIFTTRGLERIVTSA
jgi:hypothetical protein